MKPLDQKLILKDFINENYKKIQGVYVHPSCSQMLNRPVFRYMQFEHLISMIKNQKLYVPNRLSFNDRTEQGSKENPKNMFGFVAVCRNKKQQKIQNEMYTAIRKAIYSVCVSCWTYDTNLADEKRANDVEENYLMWKSYGDSGISCRIETTIRDLINSIPNDIDIEILMSNVEYQRNERVYNGVAQQCIFEKPVYYRYENELRVCVLRNDSHVLIPIDPSKMIKRITLSPFIGSNSCDFFINQYQLAFPKLNIPIEKSHILVK